MLKPRIRVPGATGKTGRVVVAELLQAGYRVRAMVRRPDARSGQRVAPRPRYRATDEEVR
jgi:uncharacterized protein YbjT (DUF2867 family)